VSPLLRFSNQSIWWLSYPALYSYEKTNINGMPNIIILLKTYCCLLRFTQLYFTFPSHCPLSWRIPQLKTANLSNDIQETRVARISLCAKTILLCDIIYNFTRNKTVTSLRFHILFRCVKFSFRWVPHFCSFKNVRELNSQGDGIIYWTTALCELWNTVS
jgi:hypothetical protein